MTTPKAATKDRWGERVYKIPRRDNGELVERPGITRVMKVAASPALDTWKQKMIATGLAHRPDLVQLAVTDPYQAAKQAIDAGKAAANKGTALHSVSELVDAGTAVADLPEVVRSPMEAYATACSEVGMRVLEREVTVGRDDHLYAGTADHIVVLENVPTIAGPVVADLKTGKGVYPDTALQLAAIANAEWIYDAEDARHRDMPEVRRDVGVVIHLTEAGCRFIPLDLTGAWEVFCGLLDAWWWQQRKGIVGKAIVPSSPTAGDGLPANPEFDVDPFDGIAPSTTNVAQIKTDDVAVARLRRRIEALEPAVLSALAENWPEGVPTLKQGNLSVDDVAAVNAGLDRVEARHGAPFPPYDEPLPGPVPVAERPDVSPRALVAADDPRVPELKRRAAALSPFWLGVVTSGAKNQGIPPMNTGRVTEAQLAVIADLLAGAEEGMADESAPQPA